MLVLLAASLPIAFLLLLSSMLLKSHRAYKMSLSPELYALLPASVVAKAVVGRMIIDTIGMNGLARCKTAILWCQRLLSFALRGLFSSVSPGTMTFLDWTNFVLIVGLLLVCASGWV